MTALIWFVLGCMVTVLVYQFHIVPTVKAAILKEAAELRDSIKSHL